MDRTNSYTDQEFDISHLYRNVIYTITKWIGMFDHLVDTRSRKSQYIHYRTINWNINTCCCLCHHSRFHKSNTGVWITHCWYEVSDYTNNINIPTYTSYVILTITNGFYREYSYCHNIWFVQV